MPPNHTHREHTLVFITGTLTCVLYFPFRFHGTRLLQVSIKFDALTRFFDLLGRTC